MYQKNCAFYIFLLLTFHINLLQSQQAPQKENVIPSVYNFSPIVNNLQLQQSLSKSRLIIIPALIAIALYAQKQNIAQMIADYPITFLATSFFTCNYFIDTISKYRQINQTLDFFIFSQNINHYMLCIMAVKNTMKQLKDIRHISFDENDFFSMVTKETGHPFHELETFTLELMNSSLNSINNLCIDIHKTDIEEKLYFLFKDKISIEHMLILLKNKPKLHAELVKFYKNPEQEYNHIITTICALLKKHLNGFL